MTCYSIPVVATCSDVNPGVSDDGVSESSMARCASGCTGSTSTSPLVDISQPAACPLQTQQEPDSARPAPTAMLSSRATRKSRARRLMRSLLKSGSASLSTNPDKKVPRNKPHIKPPLANTPMNKLSVLSCSIGVARRLTTTQLDLLGFGLAGRCGLLRLAVHRLGRRCRRVLEPRHWSKARHWRWGHSCPSGRQGGVQGRLGRARGRGR